MNKRFSNPNGRAFVGVLLALVLVGVLQPNPWVSVANASNPPQDPPQSDPNLIYTLSFSVAKGVTFTGGVTAQETIDFWIEEGNERLADGKTNPPHTAAEVAIDAKSDKTIQDFSTTQTPRPPPYSPCPPDVPTTFKNLDLRKCPDKQAMLSEFGCNDVVIVEEIIDEKGNKPAGLMWHGRIIIIAKAGKGQSAECGEVLPHEIGHKEGLYLQPSPPDPHPGGTTNIMGNPCNGTRRALSQTEADTFDKFFPWYPLQGTPKSSL